MSKTEGLSRAAWSTILFLSLPALILFADLAVKDAVSKSERILIGQTVTSFFDLRYVENAGALFGMGQGKQKFFLAGTVIAVGVILWFYRNYAQRSLLLSFGLASLLGGALGNAWDRLMINGVRDYLDFHLGSAHWPAFNIADIAITVGVGAVILHMFRDGKDKEVRTQNAPFDSAQGRERRTQK